MAAKCMVKFRKNDQGPWAELVWSGRVLNAINFPRGRSVTTSTARAARNRLMAGCAELVRDYKRHQARQRRR